MRFFHLLGLVAFVAFLSVGAYADGIDSEGNLLPLNAGTVPVAKLKSLGSLYPDSGELEVVGALVAKKTLSVDGLAVAGGGVKVGTIAATCSPDLDGAIRYSGGKIEFCNSSAWSPIAGGGGGSSYRTVCSCGGSGMSPFRACPCVPASCNAGDTEIKGVQSSAATFISGTVYNYERWCSK